MRPNDDSLRPDCYPRRPEAPLDTGAPTIIVPPVDTSAQAWPEPRPLSRQDAARPLPLEALPSWWRAWVEAEAESLQVAPEMAFAFSLGAIAALVGGRLSIAYKADWIEGTNLYVGVVSPPGERKSPVQSHACAPVFEYERRLADAVRAQIEEARARRDLLEVEVERAKRAYQRAKTAEDREVARQEYAALRAQLAATPAPVEPRRIASDVTPEGLIAMLAAQGGRLAVLADEDAMIGHLSGRYSRAPAIEPFLSAYSGKPIIVDRQGRPPIRCERPALTISTPIQPGLFAAASANAAIKDRGLLDRFVLLVPAERVGSREVDTPAMPNDVRARYRTALLSIADAVDRHEEGVTLTLSREARAVFVEWWREHERELGPTGRLAPIRSWGAKGEGRCLRIAAILHVAETQGRDLGAPVSRLAMERATAIMATLADHALVAADLVGADAGLSLARDVARWLLETHRASVTTRDVQRAFQARIRKATEASSVMRRLADHHFVMRAPDEAGPPKPGRKSEKWLVSPRLGEVLSILSNVSKRDLEIPLSTYQGHGPAPL